MKINSSPLFFFFLLILPAKVFAQQLPQQWLRSFKAQGKNSDRIAAIVTDANDNVFVAGYAGNHHGAADAFAMKRDAQGDTLWVYYYDAGGNREDYATDIVVDAGGNTYITGRSESISAYNFECFTAKISPTGTQLWVTRYPAVSPNQSYGNALTVDANGNVYVAGYTDPASASKDWLVVKYNSAGVQQWADVLNGPGNGDDEALDITLDPNGNPTVCGYSYSANASGGINLFVKQYTPAGATAWTDTYNNPNFTGNDEAKGLGFSASGDLFVGGETRNAVGFNRDGIALKYNAAGVRQWATIYSDATTTGDEYVFDVAVDDSGNTYLTGTDYQNGFVTRINFDGTQGWRKKWIGPLSNGYDVFHAITVDNNGGVYVTGRGVYAGPDYYGNGGTANQIVVKYSSGGDSLWTYRSQDTLNPSMGLAVTARNGKIFAGGFKTDTAYVDENLYTQIIATNGSTVNEWSYSGTGDAVTRGQVVRTDAQNNVYCAATVDRLYANGLDVAVIKYDPAGNLLWERYYTTRGWNNDTLTHMELDPSGNILMCISSDTGLLKNNYRMSLVKLSPNGVFLDTAWYLPSPLGSTLATSMLVRNDGSVALGALSNINGGVIVYFDNTLNQQWSAKIDSTQFAVTKVNSLAAFPNGDIGVGGFVQTGSGTTGKGVVQRFTPGGARLWTTDIDSAGVYDEIRGITVNASGNVAATGASGGITTFTAMLAVLDGTTGQLTWRQIYNPNTSNEYGLKVEFTPAGNVVYICRGWTGFVARYTTVQYSGTGTFQWATVYNQTASDREPLELLVEPNNRVVTAGWWIDATSTNLNYVLVGYNSSGVQQFLNTYSNTTSGTSNPDQLRSLTRDSQGNFIVTGESAFDFYNNFLFKMVTIKYGNSAVGVEEMGAINQDNVYVYPNPSSDGVFYIVAAIGSSAIVSGSVMDMQGKEVARFFPEQSIVHIGDKAPGMYLLRYIRSNGSIGTVKLIK
ncbi:MAG: SBBP repeat-containing protein [Bacteroidetes bacterium]|nr:SBBP repeat-containing protein [Bacteroidota bacterium]